VVEDQQNPATSGTPGRRQFVKYSFFKVVREWRLRPEAERSEEREEFAGVVEEVGREMLLRSYSLVGLRGDVDFMLWQASEGLEALQESMRRLLGTRLGRYLEQPYSLLAMTRRSMYVGKHRHEGQEGGRTVVRPIGARYLFVYPFVKTRPWYRLAKGARQGMMDEHIAIGHKYPSVKINTAYSYGLDDQEFVVAFETDSPADFLDLVMELRESEASLYTLRDTPTFTCVLTSPGEMLEGLG